MLSQEHCPYHYLASHLLCCYLHTVSLLAYESKHLAFCQLPPIPTPRGSGERLSSTSSDLSRFILEHTCPLASPGKNSFAGQDKTWEKSIHRPRESTTASVSTAGRVGNSYNRAELTLVMMVMVANLDPSDIWLYSLTEWPQGWSIHECVCKRRFMFKLSIWYGGPQPAYSEHITHNFSAVP